MAEIATRETLVATDNGWRRHFVETLALGLPLIGAQLAQNGDGEQKPEMRGKLRQK